MFSCLLLHSGSGKETVVAEKSDVTVQVVGHVGRGTASFHYKLERDYSGLLLYVPALIDHRDATRQRVQLCGCKVRVQRNGECHTHTFHLSSFTSSSGQQPTPSSTSGVPDRTSLRSRYKDLVSSFCGAPSYEDVLLHLDDIAGCSQLTVDCEFLVQSCPASADGSHSLLQYRVHNTLPTKHLSYRMNLASALKVGQVCPLFSHTPTGENKLQRSSSSDFQWYHMSDAAQNIVHVAYEHQSDGVQNGVLNPTFSSGFSVTFSEGIAAACCTGFVPKSTTSLSGESPSVPYDGILMVEGQLSREQLPAHLREKPLFSSEFVFVIDCSGSMSGTNIQSAADTLITCVKSLPVGCYFNVLAFGSTFRQLFHSSEPYSKKSVERALQFANQLQASLGGTELLAPLKWVFRRQRCAGVPCQVFIVTDGGVTNTQTVLHTVRKNREQARCHTFGIGPEVCVELVRGIAAASGGQCVLLRNGERLQTKVMDVLKESLEPSLTNTVLRWHPPEGYSVVDCSPKNLGTLYSHSPYTAYAFLRRDEQGASETERGGHCSATQGSATISGTVGEGDVEINVTQALLPDLSKEQSGELWSILWQVALWSKLRSLEMQIVSSSRKNSHDENEELEPAAKRPRLNGMTNCVAHHLPPTSAPGASSNGVSQQDRAALCREMTELSLASGIPCSLTYFTSDAESGKIRQITPNLGVNSMPRKTLPDNGLSLHYQKQLQRMYGRRKRPRSQQHHHHHREPSETSFSFASLAKSSISAVGSTLKSVVNLATFGLLSQESTQPLENGRRIEDELELQQNKDTRLHWDSDRGELVYPSFYYRSNSPNHPSSSSHHSKSKKGRKSHKHHSGQQANSASHMIPLGVPTGSCNPATAQVNGMSVPQIPIVKLEQLLEASTSITVDRETGIPTAQPSLMSDDPLCGEDDEFTISDSESDSSVDPDWEDLRRPNELLPLIHMQLFCGAWPIVRAFSYAVGVPLEEIRRLPLRAQPMATPTDSAINNGLDTQSSPTASSASIVGAPVTSNNLSAKKVDDEDSAHFWTTALAIACLEEYFTEFHSEWELVALKGQWWLQENASQTELSIDEVQRVARELVLRQS